MKKTLNELHGKAMDILKSKEDNIMKEMKMQNAKYTLSGKEVKKVILQGVNSMAKPVIGTLGAGGIYQGHYLSDGTPVILNDGVTVAQSLLPLPNIYENLIATLVLQAAQKTAMVAGDSTTRTIAMIQFLTNELLKEKRFWESRSNPYDLIKGLDLAVNDVLEYLNKKGVKLPANLKNLWKIAYTSSHGNIDIANNIKKLYSQLEDWNTEIDFEKSDMLEDYIELKKGYVLGLKSPSLNGQKKVLENPRLILCNFKLTDLGIFDYNIAKRAMTDPSPVIFIVKDYDHNVIKDLKERSKIHLVDLYLVKVDTFGSEIKKQLEDISLLSTAEIIGEEYEYNQEAVLYDMPKTRLTDASNPMPFYEMKIKKAVLTNDETILEFNTPKEVLEAHIESLKEIDFKDKVDLHNHNQRIKRLQGTTCTYYVGGNTLTEVDTKYYLVEDAVKACKSAIREGVLYGACRSDITASKYLESKVPYNENKDVIRSYKTFIKALRYPLEIMCNSTHLDYSKVLETYLLNDDLLFNFETFKYENKNQTNILDSLSSTKECILNSRSIINQFLKLGYLTN